MLSAEFFRFCFVGGAATLTHLLVAGLLLWIFPDLNLISINTFAFAVAFSVSFSGHKHFTFNREGSLLKFFLTSIVGLLINNAVVLAVSTITDVRFTAIVIGTGVAPVAVFLLSKYWVFEDK